MKYSGGPRGIWLAMSGGGTRAALFHYGALKRLHELGILEDVQAISATSGGALVAGLLGVQGPFSDTNDWKGFEQDLLDAATRGLLGPAAWAFVAWVTYVLMNLFLIIGLVLRLWLGPSLLSESLTSMCFIVFVLAMLVTVRQMRRDERSSNESFSSVKSRVEFRRHLDDGNGPAAATGSGPELPNA